MRNSTIHGLVAAIVLLGLYAVVARTIDIMRAKPDPLMLCPFCYQPYPSK